MTAPFYSEKIAYFEKNLVGQDYVIGDVHGRYDLVEKALSQVNFNPELDRLFCVGDLIDRGQYSSFVWKFLKSPYVHAIRGNHEDMLLEIYEENPNPSETLLAHYGEQIGLTWWLSVDKKERQEILSAIKQLPLIAEIDTIRGNVGLVHAEVPIGMSWNEFKIKIEQNDAKTIVEALWGRTRLTYGIDDDIEGIGRLYVGHTVQGKIRKIGNVVAIDTGAVFDKHLTIAAIACQTQVILRPQKTESDIQIIPEGEFTQKPFGKGVAYLSTIMNKNKI